MNCIDFFQDKNMILDEICNIYNLNSSDVINFIENHMDIIDYSMFIEKFSISESNIVNKIMVKCKHLTRLTCEGLHSLRNQGFLELKSILSNSNSELSKFLNKHNIFINVENKELFINSKKYKIKLSKHTYNQSLELYIEQLYDKLYKIGTTEFFLSGSNKNILDYSSIYRGPEILVELNNICKELSNNFNLIYDWENNNTKSYIVSFCLPLKDIYIDSFSNSNTREKIIHLFLKSYFDSEEYGHIDNQVIFNNIKLDISEVWR